MQQALLNEIREILCWQHILLNSSLVIGICMCLTFTPYWHELGFMIIFCDPQLSPLYTHNTTEKYRKETITYPIIKQTI
jgi:hypothetical protein